jgi:hypothetical protein
MRNTSNSHWLGSENYEPFCDVSPIAHALGLEGTAAISTTLLDTYGGPPKSLNRFESAEELLLGTHFAFIGDIPAQVEKKGNLLTIHFRLYLVRRDFWRVEHVPVVARCKERNGAGSSFTTIARGCIQESAYEGLTPHGLNEFPLAIKHPRPKTSEL